MRGSIKLFSISGIAVNLHVTFLLLLFLCMTSGPRWLFVIVSVFFFVTLHELAHALVAKHFGVKVGEITLFPIGGVASMLSVPEKPGHELLISLAGPSFNLLVVAVFFFPLKFLLGAGTLLHPLSADTWPLAVAHVYWLNLILALFNLIPAFPMDGGRIFRALLTRRFGYRKATAIAVRTGHLFALLFAYLGIVKMNFMLVAIAVFVYMAASSEEAQVGLKETLKKFRVRDILSHDFLTIRSDASLAKVLELIFHSHQEDFPVVDEADIAGFVTRQDIITNIHKHGMARTAGEIMRRDFPRVKDSDFILDVQDVMQASGLRALPVMMEEKVVGVVTLEDIGRLYAIASQTP